MLAPMPPAWPAQAQVFSIASNCVTTSATGIGAVAIRSPLGAHGVDLLADVGDALGCRAEGALHGAELVSDAGNDVYHASSPSFTPASRK